MKRPSREEAMAFARMAVLANPMLLEAVADGGVRVRHTPPVRGSDQEGAVYVETLRDGRLGNNRALSRYYLATGLTGLGDDDLTEEEAKALAQEPLYEFTFGGRCESATAKAALTASLREEAEGAAERAESILGRLTRPSR